MKKRRHIILIISLALLILLPSLACSDYGMTCTMQCQGIEDDSAWEACMLQCHEGRSK